MAGQMPAHAARDLWTCGRDGSTGKTARSESKEPHGPGALSRAAFGAPLSDPRTAMSELRRNVVHDTLCRIGFGRVSLLRGRPGAAGLRVAIEAGRGRPGTAG
jgi:hypothetical protein